MNAAPEDKALESIEAPSPQAIRDQAALALTERLICAWGQLLNSADDEVVRKTARDIADVLGLDYKAPGGSHMQGMKFSAELPPAALSTLLEGFQVLADRSDGRSAPPRDLPTEKETFTDGNELSQTPPVPSHWEAVPGSPDDSESAEAQSTEGGLE